jgi:hypothetical protein
VGSGVSWFAALNPDGTLKPITTVVKLNGTVNVSDIAINPTGTCGDDGTSSVGRYRVETSTDGTTLAEYGITCPNDVVPGCFFVDTVELAVHGLPG